MEALGLLWWDYSLFAIVTGGGKQDAKGWEALMWRLCSQWK